MFRSGSFRRRLALFVLVAVPLVLACAARPATAPVISALPLTTPVYPLQLSANRRYLVDQTNRPMFWSGDAAWSLIAQGSNADADYYLSDRQHKGTNLVLINLLEHKFAANAPRNIAHEAPFSGATFAAPNEAYFAHADYVVSAAAQRGIAVLLDPLYLGYECGSEGWCAEVQAASGTDLQAWGQYLGSRYKNFPNVVWVVGGDVDPNTAAGVPDKVNAFATALQQADSVHLITAHNVRGEMAVTPWPGAGWLSVNSTYSTYDSSYQQAQAAYDLDPPKPFFQIEGFYENEHSMTTQQLRAQAYWTTLSGGMGYVFGNCPLWGLGSPAGSFCAKADLDWKTQLDSPGSVSMVHVAELFSPRAWQDLVPDASHTMLTAGYGTLGNSDYATVARTTDGRLAVAYVPTLRTVTVDMTRLSGLAVARWYDPSNGAYAAIDGSPLANDGPHQFTSPGNNAAGDGDWVLLLEARDDSAAQG